MKQKELWIGCFLLLIGCNPAGVREVPQSSKDMRKSDFGSILGDSPILLKSRKEQIRTTLQGDCPVNKYLWMGALETIGFMPIISAIPEQRTITTDWYMTEDHPDVRVRMVVIILGKELRADAVKIRVERQKRTAYKRWINHPLSSEELTRLEILIVERARKLRKMLNNKDVN